MFRPITAVLATLFLAATAPAAERPNIVIFLADDLGFSDLGCYGSEIATPNLDRLAANGLRFTQFYNTARCWPTRASLMSGYYAQQVSMDPPRGKLPAWTRLLPQYLKPAGYRAYHSGKWHINAAPRVVADGGFDHSYLLLDHNQHFGPKRHDEDDRPLPPVKTDSGYYTATAVADYAIKYLKEHAEKHAREPFFSYVAFTVPHFPIQAPPEDIARYQDTYKVGWPAIRQARYERLKKMGIVNCALSEPEPKITAPSGKESDLKILGPGEIRNALPWNTLTAEQKEFQATKEAIHAAMVDRMDREIGRVLDQIRAMGQMDNTIVFFLSDNGASAEIMVRGEGHDRSAPPGSAATFLCLGPGGSTVSNTPFRRHKIWVHEGGIATPLIVHWPKGIAARGELRQDIGHVVDFVPTLLDLVGVKPGDTWNGAKAPAFPGRSLVPALAKNGTVAREYVFFNHSGNRAIRMGDYKLVSAADNRNDWELYNLATDRCESVNLAQKEPERAKTMAARWHALEEQFRRDAGSPDGKAPTKKGKDE